MCEKNSRTSATCEPPIGGKCDYRPAVCSSRQWLVCLVLVLALSAVWIWGFNTSYFVAPDAYDYAQMGREIRLGHGMSTLQTFPKHIPWLADKGYLGNEHWPNLHRYPLPTLLNAFFQLLVTDPVAAAVVQTGVLYILGMVVLFFLAARLTNLTVAVLSCLFYAADPFVFRSGYNGMSEAFATLLVLTILLVAFAGRGGAFKWMVLGGLCGLVFLGRTQFAFLLPLTILYAWFTAERRIRAVGLILIGLCLITAPWFTRNFLLTGNPIFSFYSGRALVWNITDLEIQLHAPVAAQAVLGEYGPAILKKFIHNTVGPALSLRHWSAMFERMQIIFPLFFFGALLGLDRSSQSRYKLFKWAVLILLFCNFVVCGMVFHCARFYVIFRPLIFVVAINAMFCLLKGINAHGYPRALKPAGIGLLVLLGLFKLYCVVSEHKAVPERGRGDLAFYESLAGSIGEDCVIASDISYKVSLYAGRRSVRLPADPNDLLEIDNKYLPIDYVLLSHRIVSPPTDMTNTSAAIRRYRRYAEFATSQNFRNKYQIAARQPLGILFVKRPEQTQKRNGTARLKAIPLCSHRVSSGKRLQLSTVKPLPYQLPR